MDRHLTVAVFVVHQGKTLLHWHKKHSMWLPVGGHVDPNESPCEAAIREAKEESGLDVELYRHIPSVAPEHKQVRMLIAPSYIQNEVIAPDHEHVDCIFYARASTFELNPLEGEVTNIGWYSLEETEAMDLEPDVREYVREVLALLA